MVCNITRLDKDGGAAVAVTRAVAAVEEGGVIAPSPYFGTYIIYNSPEVVK